MRTEMVHAGQARDESSLAIVGDLPLVCWCSRYASGKCTRSFCGAQSRGKPVAADVRTTTSPILRAMR